MAIGDGSPGVPEEHPERVVAVVLAARFFFHGGAGAAVQEALLADAAGVAHMLRAARRRLPLRVGSGKGMESWTGARAWRAWRGWATRGKAYVRVARG